MSIPTDGKPADSDVIMRMLAGPSEAVRSRALSYLRGLPDDEYFALVENTGSYQKTVKHRAQIAYAGILAAGIVVTILLSALGPFTVPIIALTIASSSGISRSMNRNGAEALHHLLSVMPQHEDCAHFNPVVLKVIDNPAWCETAQARNAALDMIRSLSDDEQYRITRIQRVQLSRVLEQPYISVPLTLATIRLLGRIGSSEVLDRIRQLTYEPLKSAESRSIKIAAIKALRPVWERSEHQAHGAELLRPAGAGTTYQSDLVRSADLNSNELMRVPLSSQSDLPELLHAALEGVGKPEQEVLPHHEP